MLPVSKKIINNPSRLSENITKINYDNKIYNFRELIFEKLKNYSKLKNNINLKKLEDLV